MSDKILVVDNDADIREIHKTLLEREGYEVHSENNSSIAWGTLRKQGDFSLLLLGFFSSFFGLFPF